MVAQRKIPEGLVLGLAGIALLFQGLQGRGIQRRAFPHMVFHHGFSVDGKQEIPVFIEQ